MPIWRGGRAGVPVVRCVILALRKGAYDRPSRRVGRVDLRRWLGGWVGRGASLVVVTVVVVVGSCSDDDLSSQASMPVATSPVVATPLAGAVETPAESMSAETPVTAVTAPDSPLPSAGAETTSAITTVAVRVDPVFTMEAFQVPEGSGPLDVSPAFDGRVWFTAVIRSM